MFFLIICIALAIPATVTPACNCQRRTETIGCEGTITHGSVTALACYNWAKKILLYDGVSIDDCQKWQMEKRRISVMNVGLCACLPFALECGPAPVNITTTAEPITYSTTEPGNTTAAAAAAGLTKGAKAGIGTSVAFLVIVILLVTVYYIFIRKRLTPNPINPPFPLGFVNPSYQGLR